jgi:putative transposase
VPGARCVAGDDLPPPPAAAALSGTAATGTGQGALKSERQQVLDVLHSERFLDVSPEETYATLLDEGTYLCSTRTMYRILAAHHGGIRERTSSPTRRKPSPSCSPSPRTSSRVGTSPSSRPRRKRTWFYRSVILDVFNRYIVDWTVQYREHTHLATALIEQATEQQQITPKILTSHADRGGPKRSKPLAFPLADLGVTKTHSRPYTSTDNPPRRGEPQNAQLPPRVPSTVRLDRARTRVLP